MTQILQIDVKIKNGKGLQRFLNKMKQFEQLVVTAGIYGRNASKKVVDPHGQFRKKKRTYKSYFNIGHLASLQEVGFSYTLTKTVKFPHPRVPKEWIILNKGTKITIPPRPAFKSTMVKYKNRIDAVAHNGINAVVTKSMTPRQVMQALGQTTKDAIISSYTDGQYTPNAKLTIWLKQSSTPLIDTKTNIVPAIQYKINKSGKVSSGLSSALRQVMSNKLRRTK